MTEKRCANCGKNYKRKKSSIGKYCSRGCFYKTRIGVKRPEHSKKMSGNGNPRWTDKPSMKMDNLHAWLHRRIPKPKLCVKCRKVKPYDLANISGNYLTKLSDWIWVCRKCHIHSDERIHILHGLCIQKGEHRSPKTEFKKVMDIGL